MEMLPILQEADGILEGAIEFERKRKAREKRKEARAAERERVDEECRRDACATRDAAEGGYATTDPEGRATLLRDQGHVPTCPPRKTVEVELDPTGGPDETMGRPPPPGDPGNNHDQHQVKEGGEPADT